MTTWSTSCATTRLGEAAVALRTGIPFHEQGGVCTQGRGHPEVRYAQVYPTYKLHDINGKPGPNGGLAFAQTLDESIWLIKIAWTYDLIRGSDVLERIRKNRPVRRAYVLRPAAALGTEGTQGAHGEHPVLDQRGSSCRRLCV